MGDDLQKKFMPAGARGAGAEGVAEVSFEHARHRFRLGALAERAAFLGAGEPMVHHSAVMAGGWFGGWSAGAGFDQ